MKLNPPETAPMDGTVILANFGSKFIQPAVWNHADPEWKVALNMPSRDEVEPWSTQFETVRLAPNRLKGWLPMPQIDNEGNVTWPSVSTA